MSLRFAQIQTIPISKPFSNTSFPIVYYIIRRCSTLCTQRLLWAMWQMRRMSVWDDGASERNLLQEQYRNNWRINLKRNWIGLEASDARAPVMKSVREKAIFGHCSEVWIGVMNSSNSRCVCDVRSRTQRIRTKLHVIKIKLMDYTEFQISIGADAASAVVVDDNGGEHAVRETNSGDKNCMKTINKWFILFVVLKTLGRSSSQSN